MYQAKGNRSGTEFYARERDGNTRGRLQMIGELRDALAAGQLILHYQPKLDLGTRRITGVEALVRWEHPTRGVLAPGAFIDLAEESGLIVGIGREVLRRACADAMSWPDGPSGPLDIAVNLSVRQLQHEDVVRDVTEVLVSTGLPPSRLTLEITESVLVADPRAAAEVLTELKRLGIRIAIDDFGTGYSSLSYLHRFPVDTLKIDKSFVDPLDTPGAELALLQAIVGLAGTLELSVVAEGIEQPSQWISLQELGCGLGQGYLFARPMPATDFDAYIGAARDTSVEV
jgi:EAL domain-containing protein (putative c-di-GMP-specific phosphodiesterase class I)